MRSDLEHPANFGRLCSKGSALGVTLGRKDRLLTPRIDGRPASWPEAIAHIARGFQQTSADYGLDSVAFYASGTSLMDAFCVVNKLAKLFIGTAKIDANSRLCMSSAIDVYRRAIGGDVVPGNYEVLDEAKLVVFVSSNAAWRHPVLYQRIALAKARNPAMRLVVIYTRRAEGCAIADLHLALRPSSDAVLFNGLLAHFVHAGAAETDFVAQHISCAEAVLATAQGRRRHQLGAPHLAPAAISRSGPRGAPRLAHRLRCRYGDELRRFRL
jgi:assimilatory nitrate reductase catalytic subunit